jgi:hypothetical protein
MGVQVFGPVSIIHGFLNGPNLLSAGEFNGGGTGSARLGGLSGDWSACFERCQGFVGANGGIGVVVGILRAVTSHVALKAAPKASAFFSELGTFLWGKLLELSDIGSINVHRDMIQVQLLLVWQIRLVLEGPEVMWLLLIAVLGSSKACVVFLFSSSNLILSRCLPLVDGMWYFISVECFAMNHLCRPSRNRTIVPSESRAHPAAKANQLNVAM